MINMKNLEVYRVECIKCGFAHHMRIDPADVRDWQEGKLIQHAMPYLSAGERELLISGICEDCFDEMFGA